MAAKNLRELLHKVATQGGEVARPEGLVQRGTKWWIRVRVPDRLRDRIGKTEICRSLRTSDFKEACRLARMERVAIDNLFGEAEAELREEIVEPVAADQLYQLARAFLHKMEADAQPIPVLSEDRELERIAVDEDAGLIGQSIEDATVQRGAISFARWAGLKLDPNSPHLIPISEAYQAAFIEHLNRRSLRLAGKTVLTVDPLFEGVDAKEPVSAPLTVKAAIQAFKDDPERASVAPKTRMAWGFRLRVFEELVGSDRLIGSIKRDDIRECREVLMEMPANAAKLYPGMSITEATLAAERDGCRKLSAKSVNLYIDQIVALFSWLEKEELVERNPAKGMKGPPLPRGSRRRPLSQSEINALLRATQSKDVTKPWTYWLPRVALLNGMRLSEIAGLATGDVEEIDGVWTFRVRPNAHRDLKTHTSTRDIPIHPRLVALGLPELAKGRHSDALLFADAPSTNGTSNAAQKRMGRVVRSVISDERATFHSLRHNFRDATRNAGIPSDVVAKLGGWAGNGNQSMDGYGRGHRLETLREWITKVSYDGVEID